MGKKAGGYMLNYHNNPLDFHFLPKNRKMPTLSVKYKKPTMFDGMDP